ncbi:hypothetical protein KKF92_03540 [Patescibacteria group bacterium]|nr:hypothetical protein [Patescibacteria group bacterium]
MEFKPIAFPKCQTQYITPSWPDLDRLAFEVAQAIRSDGLKFDRIVTLAKGGWPMTRSLVDYLQVKEVASIGVKFYAGINQQLKRPQVYQDIPISIKGEDVLLFDDVADTGASFEFVSQLLKKKEVESLTTASLFYKPHSSFKPNFYSSTTSAWIIFPYDAVEGIIALGNQWQKQGYTRQEIIGRFNQLHFSADVIRAYFK